MITPIGRVEVSTSASRIGRLVVWEATVTVHFPRCVDWCCRPHAEVWDVHVSMWDAFVGHAMIVGLLRTQYELGRAEPAYIPVRRQIGGRWQTVTLTLTQYLHQERPELLTAEVVWEGYRAGSTAARTPRTGDPSRR